MSMLSECWCAGHTQRLRFHRSIVNAYVIDLARPESAISKIRACANDQRADRAAQSRFCVAGHLDIVHIDEPIRPVPDQTDTVPITIADKGLRR